MQLETERFLIRSLTVEDVTDRYMGWLQDEEVTQYLNARRRNNDKSEIQQYVAQHDNITSFHVGIFTKDDNLHIGNFSLRHDPTNDLVQISLLIGEKEWWGKGVVLEARARLLDFAFDELDAYKVWGNPIARNFAAVFNYQKQGFVKEGTFRGHKKTETGERFDLFQFAILRDDWEALKRNGG